MRPDPVAAQQVGEEPAEDLHPGIRRPGRAVRVRGGAGGAPRTGGQSPQGTFLVRGQGCGGRGRGVVGQCRQGAYEQVEQEPGRGLLEQIGGVLQPYVEAALLSAGGRQFRTEEGQVELGGPQFHRFDAGCQTAQRRFLPLPGRRLEGEHDLEEGVVGEGAFGVEVFDEEVEGEVVVGVGGEVGVADAGEEVGEAGRAGQVGAQDQRVDEEAHHIVQRLVGAARDGRADGDVLAAAGRREGEGQRGVDRHEQARPVRGAHLQQPGVGSRVQPRAQRRPAEGGFGGPRPVRRKLHDVRQALQRRPPEAQPPRQDAGGVVGVAEHVVLPEGVVGVLDRQGFPGGWVSCRAGGVGVGEVAQEGAQGPAVGGDVVQQQYEDRSGGVRAGEQPYPQRRIARDVERLGGELRHARVPPRPARRARDDREVHGAVGRPDPLVRLAVRAGRQDRAQALVARHQVPYGRRQRHRVGHAVQAQHHRRVVRRRRPLEPVQEPQPPLRVRQRDHVRTSDPSAAPSARTSSMRAARSRSRGWA